MKLAGIVFSFNRPQYLRQVLERLSLQTDTDLDWVVMQDQTDNRHSRIRHGRPEDVAACLRQIEAADLPRMKLILNDQNRGMGWQKWRAMKYVFEQNDYDCCICFEDDLLVSSHYVRIMRVLLKQFGADRTVATVQASDRFNDRFSDEDLGVVIPAWRHYWGYGTWRDRWVQQHRPLYKQYMQLIKGCDYKQRPHTAIQALIKDKHSSHDGALDWCVKTNRQKKLTTRVSRATYIGEAGVHSTPQHFETSGYKGHLNQLISFAQDEDITEFRLEGDKK